MEMENKLLEDFVIVVDETKPSCKGRIYRLRINDYLGKRGELIYKETFVPVKKMSCQGCESCGWIDEFIREEMLCCNGIKIVDDGVRNDGDLFMINCEESIDYETGIKEISDFYLQKIINNSN